MFGNLDKELASNKVSWRAAAQAIGMPESTFRKKITEGEFSVTEAFTIKCCLFPKFTLEYLFEKTDEEKSA